MKRKLFILCMLFASLNAIAQTRTVTGTVTEVSGETVIGATVLEQGTQNYATTDIDGNFSITLTTEAPKLVISMMGYNTVTQEVGTRAVFNIVMESDSQLLDELVVTGYGGKTLRSKVTNSIATVDNELLQKGLYSNPAQALSGAVPGVRVIQSSGSPTAVPTIILRGGTNFDGTGSPLIIIDGQIREGLNDVNPEDIESMEVLKDAGATALYGARASNGVVLVTTKSGKSGSRSITASAKIGINYMNNQYEFLGAEDYITAMRTAYVNTPWAPQHNLNGKQPMGIGNDINDPKMIWNLMEYKPEYDYLLSQGWQTMIDPINPDRTLIFKETFPSEYNFNNPALTQTYNVSMSGGNENGNYYAGLGYHDSEGLPIQSFNERLSFILNGSYKVTDFITSTSRVNFTRSNWQDMPATQSNVANYFGRIMSVPTTVRYEDEDGNPLLGSHVSDGNQSFQDDQFFRLNTVNRLTLSQDFDVKLTKDLSFKVTGMWDYTDTYKEAFNQDYEQTPGVFNRTRSTSASFDRIFKQTYNAVLNYNKTIAEDHTISVLAGTEYYDRANYGLSASGSGAPVDDFRDLGLTSEEEGKRSIDSWHSQSRIISFFGRVNYDYRDKYLISAVLRHDGYSTLLDNRWGTFPGVSAGWIFNREEFAKEYLSFLSFGKLRASYGINGNAQGIGTYELQGSYTSTAYNGNVGYLIGTLPNPGLLWEQTRTAEIGLDLGFFENRLNTNFTFYDRLTSDKYASLSLPSTTGFSSVKNNNGKFQNRGIEVDIQARIIEKKDLKWGANFNISYNKNKVIQLPDNGLERNMQSATEIYTGGLNEDGSYATEFVGGYQQGYEPGVLIGYEAVGIYQSLDDIPKGLVVETGNGQGKYQYSPDVWETLSESQKASGILLQPGDMQWKDVNGDGRIDSYDRVVMGNTTPRFTGGFNTTLTWKGLSLYARFDFALDYYIYDSNTPWILGAAQGTFNTTTDYFNTWSTTNTSATYPRYVYADFLGPGNYNRTSTLFAYKGDYLAFREVSLSYTLPKDIAKKMACQKVDISVSGQNLGYLTQAKNIFSPEASSAGWGYSLPRTIVFSASLTF